MYTETSSAIEAALDALVAASIDPTDELHAAQEVFDATAAAINQALPRRVKIDLGEGVPTVEQVQEQAEKLARQEVGKTVRRQLGDVAESRFYHAMLSSVHTMTAEALARYGPAVEALAAAEQKPGALMADPDTDEEFAARKAYRAARAEWARLDVALAAVGAAERMPVNTVTLCVNVDGKSLADLFPESLRIGHTQARGFEVDMYPASDRSFELARELLARGPLEVPADFAELAARGRAVNGAAEAMTSGRGDGVVRVKAAA